MASRHDPTHQRLEVRKYGDLRTSSVQLSSLPRASRWWCWTTLYSTCPPAQPKLRYHEGEGLLRRVAGSTPSFPSRSLRGMWRPPRSDLHAVSRDRARECLLRRVSGRRFVRRGHSGGPCDSFPRAPGLETGPDQFPKLLPKTSLFEDAGGARRKRVICVSTGAKRASDSSSRHPIGHSSNRRGMPV